MGEINASTFDIGEMNNGAALYSPNGSSVNKKLKLRLENLVALIFERHSMEPLWLLRDKATPHDEVALGRSPFDPRLSSAVKLPVAATV
jgi:hypothetical protein